MYINATLLMQAIHFGCAYCLLRFFLYKPVVAMIEQEQNEVKQIKDDINSKQLAINEYQQQATAILRQAQLNARTQQPAIHIDYPFSVEQIQAVPHVAGATVKKLADDISHVIVEKINHVP